MAVSAETLRLADSSASRARSRIARIDRELTTRYTAEWNQRAGRLDAEFRRLAASSKRGWPSGTEIRRSAALRAILTGLDASLGRLTSRADVLVSTAIEEALTAGADEQRAIVASQLPPAWRDVLSEGLDPRYAERLRSARRRAAALLNRVPRRVSREVRRAAALPVPDAAVAVVVRIVVERIRQAFLSGLSRSLTIAGTEVMDAHRTGARMAQAKSSDVLEGWIWVARLDSRICPACLSLHGSVHPLDEPGPMGHARCRCIRVPKTKSWKELGFDLGLDDPPEPESLVADAQKWFWALPRSDQLRIMGPSRLDLLGQGEVLWSDLAVRVAHPGWRDAYQARPVRDLRK